MYLTEISSFFLSLSSSFLPHSKEVSCRKNSPPLIFLFSLSNNLFSKCCLSLCLILSLYLLRLFFSACMCLLSPVSIYRGYDFSSVFSHQRKHSPFLFLFFSFLNLTRDRKDSFLSFGCRKKVSLLPLFFFFKPRLLEERERERDHHHHHHYTRTIYRVEIEKGS